MPIGACLRKTVWRCLAPQKHSRVFEYLATARKGDVLDQGGLGREHGRKAEKLSDNSLPNSRYSRELHGFPSADGERRRERPGGHEGRRSGEIEKGEGPEFAFERTVPAEARTAHDSG